MLSRFLHKPSVIFGLVVAFAIVYGVLISNVSNEYNAKRAELESLKQAKIELEARSVACERELKYVQSDAGIQLYAHMYGYQFPDETCYTAVAATR